jgi:anaerobic selenocysteine-containing dehydrogenase
MKISRREFLRLLGVTGAVVGGASPTWAVPDEWVDKLYKGPLKESWKVSTCVQCPGGCGIKVRLIDGIPVRITGNPISPVNRGFVCPMGEAGLEYLYNPGRITKPLVRKGKKGEGSFEAVTWGEALKKIALSFKGKPGKRFACIYGDRNTVTGNLLSEFLESLGSPNLFLWKNPEINELGITQATGKTDIPSFDLERSDYILTFGTNLLEETPSPLFFNRIYGKLKAGRVRSGLKMVHASSRASQAGINATEWVRTKPGSLGVLALGMAYVLIRDKNYDSRFLSNHTKGFKEGKENFLKLVSNDYYPDRVSKVTGIPAKTVIRLAREFGSAKAPIALSGGMADRSEMGLFNEWAITSLNALTGGFAVPGLWRDATPNPWKRPAEALLDTESLKVKMEGGTPGTSSIPVSWAVEQMPEIFHKDVGKNLDTLMIAQANPIYHATERETWEKYLLSTPTVVQFTSILDDTSPYADVVFPVSTYLEQWDLTLPVPGLPFASSGLVQPIVKPFGGTRSLGEVIIELTKSGIGSIGRKGPSSYKSYIQNKGKALFSTAKGTPFFETVSLKFLDELRKRGWQVYSYPKFGDFWKLITEKGGWWEPDGYSTTNWRSRGSFTFMNISELSRLLEKRGKGGEGKKEKRDAPHLWLEKKLESDEGEATFTLVPFNTIFNITGDGASQPLLQELFGLQQREFWKTWAEINPERAEKLGIQDGDTVKVSSGKGNIIATIKVVPTVSEETLAIPVGQGHRGLGEYADGVGSNPIDIMEQLEDSLSWRNSLLSTRVKIEKISS